MSTGGVFKLITNDGIQDRLLMATAYLEKRIVCINEADRIRRNKLSDLKEKSEILNSANSWTTSLAQIEKTHNIFVNGSFKPFVAMGYEYSKSPSTGNSRLGDTVSFVIPQFGDFFNDMVVHIRLTGLKSVDPGDKVRYVAFLGHKLITKASFYIQNNLIDDYTSHEYNAFYNFQVPPNKKNGWLKCMGQEMPTLGYVTSDPTVDETREYRWFGDGPQTFKRSHDSVDLWIPILFWFRDIKHAVPNIVIPYGQTKLELNLAKANELISFANYAGNGSFVEPTLDKMDLYTNHIFMVPCVHNIFLKNFGFSLIRVHKRQVSTVNERSGTKKLNDLKWPIETMYVAFRPTINEILSQYWYKNSVLSKVNISVPVSNLSSISINQAQIQKESQSVDTLELQSHGINIFKDSPSSFYSTYLPYRFGKSINTPEDPGWFMMNFNFNPGENDPSGHINVSRAREFYLSYTSSYINTNTPVEMIVLADALNFFLVKDGSGILRFST